MFTRVLLSLIVANYSTVIPQAPNVPAKPDVAAIQTAPASGFALLDGTPIKLRLARNISSADAKVGESVDFEVLEEVKIGERIIVDKGAVANGTVTEAQPKRRMGRTGKLDVNIDSVRLANGDKAALRAVKGGEGGGHVGSMTVGIVATSLVFFPAAPLFLLMHGKDITIPKGTEITGYVNGNVNLNPDAFNAGQGKIPAISQSHQPAVEATAKMSVKSTPDGADVSVDGKFVGSAPSTLSLTPGDHEIIVQKAGFKPWKRTVTAGSGNSLTIDAVLEREP